MKWFYRLILLVLFVNSVLAFITVDIHAGIGWLTATLLLLFIKYEN